MKNERLEKNIKVKRVEKSRRTSEDDGYYYYCELTQIRSFVHFSIFKFSTIN